MPITTSEPPPPKSASRLIGGTGAPPFGSDVPQHARDREVVDVVADVAGERAVLAPAGHARVDEPRVAGAARVGTDAESLGDAGPEPFEQHVGAARTGAARPRRASGCFRSMPTLRRPRSITEYGDTNPATFEPRRDVGRAVEAQHLGAHVGEQHPRELHRPDVRQLDDADRRRAVRARSRPSSLKTRAAFSQRNFGHTWSRNGTSGSSAKMRSMSSPIG